jgi:hypothetical protein
VAAKLGVVGDCGSGDDTGVGAGFDAPEGAGLVGPSLAPLDDDVADGAGADRSGVTVAGAEGAAGPALDDEDAAVVFVSGVGAGAGEAARLDAAGRAGADRGVVSSLPFEASLDSPDFTSDAFTVIGDAPPPGLCRDVLSGR